MNARSVARAVCVAASLGLVTPPPPIGATSLAAGEPGPVSSAAPPASAYAVLQRYSAAETRVRAELGDYAVDFGRRLADDLYRPADAMPAGFVASDWNETIGAIAQLDREAVEQLVSGVPEPLHAVPGLHEFFVPSRTDKTWQAVAVYVPSTVTGAARVPLAIVLHGNPQTEAELLGQPFLRRLADRTRTIVVAPYGRGLYDFAEPAESDLYDLLGTVQRVLPVDANRAYLVGYSMGGFSVFKVGPRGGHRWRAAMCISGAILNSGVRPVTIAWQDLPVYVVTGAHDESIPTIYGEQTARFLAAVGVPVSFYEEAQGTHLLRTLVPSLERAWLDMHEGTERPDSVPHAGSGGLPQSAPGATVKI